MSCPEEVVFVCTPHPEGGGFEVDPDPFMPGAIPWNDPTIEMPSRAILGAVNAFLTAGLPGSKRSRPEIGDNGRLP